MNRNTTSDDTEESLTQVDVDDEGTDTFDRGDDGTFEVTVRRVE